MSPEHIISNRLFKEALGEYEFGNHWIAYNTKSYYLDSADMWFFRNREEAIDFANNNISDHDAFAVIHANSLVPILRQSQNGADIPFNPGEGGLEEMLQEFDWREVFYDPLHDTIEAKSENEKEELAKMETLLAEWESLYNRNPEAALALAVRYWEGHPMESYKNDFINSKTKVMNEKNLEYLKDNLKYLGFGEKQHEALEASLKEGKESFQLHYAAEMNKKKLEATLHFRRSDSSDMYFLNSYKASLERSNGEKVDQTFYLNKGKGVTAKEAYNLLEGRAVHKELTTKAGEPYEAWIQLDFENKDKHNNHEVKQYHENYAYDLKEALSRFPIQELDAGDKEKSLLQSLQKGNLQSVTLVANGEGLRVFVEANPQYKTVNIYNEKMQRLNQDQRQELMKKPELREGREQGQGQSKEQKRDQKKPKSIRDDDDLDRPKRSRKKGISL